MEAAVLEQVQDDSHRRDPVAFSSGLSKRQKTLPASLKISSYLNFQSQVKTTPFPVKGSPIRRKPVPGSASLPSTPTTSGLIRQSVTAAGHPLRESVTIPSLEEVISATAAVAAVTSDPFNSSSLAPHDEAREQLDFIRDLDQYVPCTLCSMLFNACSVPSPLPQVSSTV